MMPNVILAGDSIFDNAAYVAGGPDVVAQLAERLPGGWRATLVAVDGAVTADVPAQLSRVPTDASHLFVSVGGNDALGHIDILERRAGSTAEVLDLLADVGERFERRYRAMLEPVLGLGLPTTLCTIYNGRLPDPATQRRASTALMVFNDVILRAAVEARAGVIDLRLVCSDPEDYANPIEPSVRGGAKIADAIARALREEGSSRGTRVIV
jgi:lysophospholipase L1-like esterase